MTRLAAVLTLALALPTTLDAQGKLPLGFGGGSFAGTAGPADVAGQFTFAHAIGYRAYENDDRSRRFTVVLLSDSPIDEARAQDEHHLAAEAKAGRLKVLQLRIANADGAVTQHAVFDERGRTLLEAPGKANYTKTTFITTRIEGQVFFYPAPDTAATVQRGYTAFFNARVRQGPWVEPGEANGRVTIGARQFEMRHASRFETDDTTTVVVSSLPLPDFDGREALAEIAVAQNFAVLWTTVERKTGKVQLSRCLGPGLPGGEAEAPGIDWHREDWARGLMRGRLASPDAAPPGAACLADVYFAATAP
jgi:hypothetical protein